MPFKRKEQPVLEDYNRFGYAMAKVYCNCDYHQMALDKSSGTFYCRRCGRPMKLVPHSEAFRTVEDMALRLYTAYPEVKEMIIAYERKFNPVKVEEPPVAEAPEDEPPQETTPEQDSEEVPESGGHLAELEALVESLTARIGKMEASHGEELKARDEEAARLRSENRSLEARARELSREVSDLDATRVHLAREISQMREVDVRGITEAFLEFTTAIANNISDRDGIDLREIFGARFDRLWMELSRNGVELICHGRGDPIGDDAVEVTWSETRDPSEHLKVSRCVRMGCAFAGGILPGIPEKAVVYRCTQDKMPAKAHVETRLREAEQ